MWMIFTTRRHGRESEKRYSVETGIYAESADDTEGRERLQPYTISSITRFVPISHWWIQTLSVFVQRVITKCTRKKVAQRDTPPPLQDKKSLQEYHT